MNRTLKGISLFSVLLATLACGVGNPTALPPTPIPASMTPEVLTSPAEEDKTPSAARMLQTLADLTQIQAYSGFRSAGTQGEQEARTYIQDQLAQLDWLQNLGMIVSEEPFEVFMTTEFYENRLEIVTDGISIIVPVSAMRGNRDVVVDAMRMDSDNVLNDRDRNPVNVSGKPLWVSTPSELVDLADAAGQIVFVDYALVDAVITPNTARNHAARLLQSGAEGIVLLTRFSNEPDESHGTYAGEGGAFANQVNLPRVPVLIARWEDLQSAGIPDEASLSSAEKVNLTWDADVLSPATSGNVIAHIPGKDPERALILGGHLDSPNSPGAMDNGSGAAITLETAVYLNHHKIQPELDLYLVWFGSEELGLYGSAAFTAAHQDLLDRAVAVTTFDCLTRPVEGIPAQIMLMYGGSSPYQADPWAIHLQEELATAGIMTNTSFMPLSSDNGSFSGYAIPNLDVIYTSSEMEDVGVWFAGHMHDPYDTVELATEMQSVLVQMAQVAILAATQPATLPDLNPNSDPTHRLVVVSSHTQAIHMTPTMQFDLGAIFAEQGWDVDLVPYGAALTSDLLLDADLVIALPVIDYLPAGEAGVQDTGWSSAELQAFQEYVAAGGMLVVTNSANRLKYYNRVYDRNEDMLAQNALANLFGVTFRDQVLDIDRLDVAGGHPLTRGHNSLNLSGSNAVPFTLSTGTLLAGDASAAILAILPSGNGEVLVLADLSVFGSSYEGAINPELIENLAGYAARR